MNQPPGGFDPPDDGYGGAGRKGGTIPGGPPIDIDPAILGGTQVGGQVGPPPAGPTPTLIDHEISPAAFRQPPPAYPAPNVGPIGYAPVAPPRHRTSSSGSGLGVVFGIGFVVLLVGGGAAGAVVYARGTSSTTEDGGDPPILTFAPPATIEAEGEQPYVPEEPPSLSDPIPEDTGVAVATPPPAKTTARPPTTSTATATSTATSTATATTTATGTSTAPPPTATATGTSPGTATGTATGTSTGYRPPRIIIGPPRGTATGTSTGTGTSPARPPRFKIPAPK